MKGFGIEIKNNLLDPKHIEHMGIAVWLYMWCIDKMTSIDESGVGKVLGGKPIKYEEDIKSELGISVRTYRRWVTQLTAGGYINTITAPYGLIFSVNKAHKRFGKRYAENGTADTETSAKSGTPEGRPETAHQSAEVAHQSDKSGTPNKTVSVDNTGRHNKKNPARSAQEEKEIADTIEAFKDVNPSYKTLFPRSPQREAAWRLLQQFGFPKLHAMVEYLRRSNAARYAPTITTPVQLESKLGELIAWSEKQRAATGGKGKRIISAATA